MGVPPPTIPSTPATPPTSTTRVEAASPATKTCAPLAGTWEDRGGRQREQRGEQGDGGACSNFVFGRCQFQIERPAYGNRRKWCEHGHESDGGKRQGRSGVQAGKVVVQGELEDGQKDPIASTPSSINFVNISRITRPRACHWLGLELVQAEQHTVYVYLYLYATYPQHLRVYAQ
ncbi:hypothetical protein D9619_012216 [Psilocybe cf. subviscida]|uniref:Uncharacterized protein n=1 Tax=Psilocybe cf. subviscida TaxID=2480587 RepID=A0A8H5B7E7_9AGAR|nr:hypothetical protein D9619_012216 [Psilocybe cf. subviscida]